MKLAPNVKQQSRGIKHKGTEVIIFAGSDAWAHAKQWQEHDARMAGDNEPPVWLGEQQLYAIRAVLSAWRTNPVAIRYRSVWLCPDAGADF